MALPYSQPDAESTVQVQISSIGATPTTAWVASPVRGRIQRTGCTVISGTSSGATATIAVKVYPVGGTLSAEIGTPLVFPAGSIGTSTEDFPSFNGASVYVNDGDLINFIPTGGTGASVVGQCFAVIRRAG